MSRSNWQTSIAKHLGLSQHCVRVDKLAVNRPEIGLIPFSHSADLTTLSLFSTLPFPPLNAEFESTTQGRD
jgi:hypothetical protein